MVASASLTGPPSTRLLGARAPASGPRWTTWFSTTHAARALMSDSMGSVRRRNASLSPPFGVLQPQDDRPRLGGPHEAEAAVLVRVRLQLRLDVRLERRGRAARDLHRDAHLRRGHRRREQPHRGTSRRGERRVDPVAPVPVGAHQSQVVGPLLARLQNEARVAREPLGPALPLDRRLGMDVHHGDALPAVGRVQRRGNVAGELPARVLARRDEEPRRAAVHALREEVRRRASETEVQIQPVSEQGPRPLVRSREALVEVVQGHRERQLADLHAPPRAVRDVDVPPDLGHRPGDLGKPPHRAELLQEPEPVLEPHERPVRLVVVQGARLAVARHDPRVVRSRSRPQQDRARKVVLARLLPHRERRQAELELLALLRRRRIGGPELLDPSARSELQAQQTAGQLGAVKREVVHRRR